VHFILKRGKQAPQCELIIVDECSTVDADVAKDLLSYQIPVLTLGDPFQLPSIDGIEFFMNAKPDATLTEVLRQDKNSPILELAARVRQNLNLKCGRYGDSEILPLSQLTTDHLARRCCWSIARNRRRRDGRRLHVQVVWRGAAAGVWRPSRCRRDCRRLREGGGCFSPSPRLCRSCD
jgi:exodeoxyribonuclease V